MPHPRTFVLFAALVATATAPAQQLLLPPDFALTSAGNSRSTWQPGGFRFQMMYDNAAFLGSGVTGPITIQRLRFRAEDGERNLGGQVYGNVTLRLASSPTTTAVVRSLAADAGSTASSIAVGGIAAAEFASGSSTASRCFTLVGTSGANLGVTRPISGNTATAIAVSPAFPSAPAPGDTFDVVRAPITYANMAQAFAANVGAIAGATETIAAVTVAPATGTAPNDYVIDLPLTTAAFTYDPTTMGNLVVEVAAANAPTPNAKALVPFATSANAGASRARRLAQSSASAATGSLADFASVVLLDFVGGGGQADAALPATATSIGAGCNAASPNVAQYFAGAEEFDLRGPARSIRFTPDVAAAPTLYTATPGVAAVDLSQAVGPANLGDDGVTTVSLATAGWTSAFAHPGGATTALGACTNGYVWLAGANTSDFTPSVAEWLGGAGSALPARMAPFWHDFHAGRNAATHPGCGLYCTTDTSGGPGNAVTYVTWKDVGEFNTVSATGGHSVNTMQAVFYEGSNEVEFRYGAMTGARAGGGITGYSRGSLAGADVADSGSRDLSHELPVASSASAVPARAALAMAATARPVRGTTIALQAANVPAETGLGLFLLDFAARQPGVAVPGITDAGCILTTDSALPAQIEVVASAGSTATSAPLAVPADPLFNGATLYAQFTFLRATLTAATSNGVKLVIGNR